MKKLVNESLYEFEDNIHATVQDESLESEGAHYKAKLEEIVEMAEKLYSNLPEGDIPAWVGDKIVVAKEYLYGVTSWLHSIEEKVEGEIEGANREMDSDEESDLESAEEDMLVIPQENIEVEDYDENMLTELPDEVEDIVNQPVIDTEDEYELAPMAYPFPKIR